MTYTYGDYIFAYGEITCQACGLDKKISKLNLLIFWCTRWGFAETPQTEFPWQGSAAFSGSREPLGSSLSNGNKKTPTRGVLVYPLGFEPRLDSVGDDFTREFFE